LTFPTADTRLAGVEGEPGDLVREELTFIGIPSMDLPGAGDGAAPQEIR
jgi:hypothetical protein